MKILIAGSDTNNSEQFTINYGLGKLYSYLNERQKIRQWKDENLLMVDSGAHSWNKSTITKIGVKGKDYLPSAKWFIDDYVLFIKCHAKKKVVYVEFDVYGHLTYDYITKKYHEIAAVEGNFKIMRVYHPMIDDGTMDILKSWIAEGQDYIGIGNDSTDMLDDIFQLTQDKVRVHGFAMTKLNLLEKYPFYSCDSTSPLATVMFGKFPADYLTIKDKEKVIEERSIEIFQEDTERLENAIRKVQETEEYLTSLWKKRNVVWKPLF